MDEFAEFGEPGFVGGEQTADFFEGFEDGEGAGRIVDGPVGVGEVTLAIGAVRFGLGETLGDGEVFFEVGLS